MVKGVLAYTAGILALLITGYIVLTALDKPTGELLNFILLLLGQASGTVAILVKQSLSDNKIQTVSEKVERVEQQTNGHMTTLIQAATEKGKAENAVRDSPGWRKLRGSQHRNGRGKSNA